MDSERVFGALSGESVEFKFNTPANKFYEKVLKIFGLWKSTRSIFVHPLTLGARAQYSKYARKLDVFKMSKEVSVPKVGLILGGMNTDDLIKTLAVVLHNNWRKEPPKWLINALKSLNQEELDYFVLFIDKSVDTESFLNSIISIVGMSLQTEEIIAPEKQKDQVGIK